MADIPLLDEAAELLGEDNRAQRARAERERRERVEYAEGVVDLLSRDLQAPEVLLGGNHAEIRRWREQAARAKTARLRPDLLKS